MEDERSYLSELVKLIPDGELHTAVRFLEFLAFGDNLDKKKPQQTMPNQNKKTAITEIAGMTENTDIPEGVMFTGIRINEADGSKLEEARKAMDEGCFITPEDYLKTISSGDGRYCR